MRPEIHLSPKKQKYMTIFIQVMIVISLLNYCLKTVPELSGYQFAFKVLDIIWGGIFLVEYVVRIISAKRKLKFIFSFYGIIDFLAIIPTALTLGLIDLHALRVFRLIRVFRLLHLIKYSKAAIRLYRALTTVKEEFMVFTAITFILIFLSSIGIHHFEHDAQPEVFRSVFHSIWWSIVTVTTVGYGDVVPITVGGKMFASLILFIGVSVISVPAGLITYALTKVNKGSEK